VREIVFINKNAPRWKTFEAELERPGMADPDALADMFIQLTDDLSYSRTYYPGTETENYLNGLALKTHQRIYKTKKERRGRLLMFFKFELPLEFVKSWREMAISAVIFFSFVLIGALSAANDETFVRLILGDGYVDMTIENIESGDPMSVYKHDDSIQMFLAIAQNNLRVAAYVYFFSLFTSFGTGLLLMYNGIMLGSFQYFFFKYNVLYESILSIWIHGTIEIFAIVVAGAAGIIMGNGWLFPGTYSRGVSFRRAALRGAKILLGLTPFIILAAFLESFVTRHTEWHDVWRIGIIVLSLALIVFYFFWYPSKLNKRLKTDADFRTYFSKILK